MSDVASWSRRLQTTAAPTNRHMHQASPGLVVVGASTGGPQALVILLGALAPVLSRIPVCVTLHMPPDLMHVIAAHVARVCLIETNVVTDAGQLTIGRVHFAPGDRNLTFRRSAAGVDVVLTPSAPGDFCKHAIDTMFASAASSYGTRTLGIVLTGMGTDGLIGSREIIAAGGQVVAQDKASSAVWGMPGAVTKANLASATLNLAGIAEYVTESLRPLTRLS